MTDKTTAVSRSSATAFPKTVGHIIPSQNVVILRAVRPVAGKANNHGRVSVGLIGRVGPGNRPELQNYYIKKEPLELHLKGLNRTQDLSATMLRRGKNGDQLLRLVVTGFTILRNHIAGLGGMLLIMAPEAAETGIIIMLMAEMS